MELASCGVLMNRGAQHSLTNVRNRRKSRHANPGSFRPHVQASKCPPALARTGLQAARRRRQAWIAGKAASRSKPVFAGG
jgi:hypothetical protein